MNYIKRFINFILNENIKNFKNYVNIGDNIIYKGFEYNVIEVNEYNILCVDEYNNEKSINLSMFNKNGGRVK